MPKDIAKHGLPANRLLVSFNFKDFEGPLFKSSVRKMEEGTRTKKTIFVGGIGDEVDETVIVETFSTFGTRFSL